MGFSLGAILQQDSGAKIQTKRYLSKYPKQGLVLVKEQGGSTKQSTINHISRDSAIGKATCSNNDCSQLLTACIRMDDKLFVEVRIHKYYFIGNNVLHGVK